jgi:hypothetical protein
LPRWRHMKILAQLIWHELRLESNDLDHCAIYEKELQRILAHTRAKSQSKDRAIRKKSRVSDGLLQPGIVHDL